MPRKLTMEEVKLKLSFITKTIIILDEVYVGNKVPMNCECLVCNHKFPAKWNNLSSNESGCPQCYYLSKFVTEEHIKNYIESTGYILNWVKNIGKHNTEIRINLTCMENHTYETSWDSFSGGKLCKKCQREVANSKTKNDINEIKNEIYEAGFSIVEPFEYKNNKSEFKLICSEGHPWEGHYNHFSTQKFCVECKYGHPRNYTLEQVGACFKDKNCELLSNQYTNNDTILEYKCSCGNLAISTLRNFQKSLGGCNKCSEYKRHHDIDTIREMFEDVGYTLLTNIYDPYGKLDYLCDSGHTTSILLADFQYGVRCGKCFHMSISGENNYNWNPNLTQDEREKNRKYPEYQQWRIAVYTRDSYTCQCCGDNKGGNLNAHHLDSHSWCKERRLDLDNGVTLCEDCHSLNENSFHKIYGFKDTTEEQFIKWMSYMKQYKILQITL